MNKLLEKGNLKGGGGAISSEMGIKEVNLLLLLLPCAA